MKLEIKDGLIVACDVENDKGTMEVTINGEPKNVLNDTECNEVISEISKLKEGCNAIKDVNKKLAECFGKSWVNLFDTYVGDRFGVLEKDLDDIVSAIYEYRNDFEESGYVLYNSERLEKEDPNAWNDVYSCVGRYLGEGNADRITDEDFSEENLLMDFASWLFMQGDSDDE